VVDEALPAGRSFKEVVDLALNDFDRVSTSAPDAGPSGAAVPRLEAAVSGQLAVAWRPRSSSYVHAEVAICDCVHNGCFRSDHPHCPTVRPDSQLCLSFFAFINNCLNFTSKTFRFKVNHLFFGYHVQ